MQFKYELKTINLIMKKTEGLILVLNVKQLNKYLALPSNLTDRQTDRQANK